MSWAAINTAIAGIIAGVAGVGRVHSFRRLATEDASFKTLYSLSNVVNAWEVSRTAYLDTRINQRASDPNTSRLTHTFTLFGYYGIEDASSTELIFQQLIEDIAEAFRGDATLNGTAEWSSGLRAALIERREFYGLGVHYAECVLDATEYLDP